MKLFDSHCHLNLDTYSADLPEVIARAERAGVKKMMVVGISLDQSRKAVRIAENWENCCASVGIHPHDSSSCSEESLRELKKLAENRGAAAWGEIGLDFNRMHSPPDIQEKWFVKQMETAGELGLPLIFHERDSGGRFLEILKARFGRTKGRGVVHCFSGTEKELESYLEMGFSIGITGIITIKKRGEKLRAMVKDIPRERLLIETDAPFLTPAPEKNHAKRNEPAFVKSVLLKLAEVLGADAEELSETLWRNTCRLYGIAD